MSAKRDLFLFLSEGKLRGLCASMQGASPAVKNEKLSECRPQLVVTEREQFSVPVVREAKCTNVRGDFKEENYGHGNCLLLPPVALSTETSTR